MKNTPPVVASCQPLALDRCECMSHILHGQQGHLGLTMKALPFVTPIRYRLIAGSIVWATGSSTELAAARNQNVACIEVSGRDAAGDDWSVVAIGRMRETIDPRHLWPDEQPLPPAWGAPLADEFVALDIELLSGTSTSGNCPH